jgi:hypothetical protein
MRTLAATIVLVMCGGVAAAQPGNTEPVGPSQPPPPPPPSGGYAPPAYQYQPPPQVAITAEEAALLQRGEIDDGSHLLGIAASVFVGFGAGQAVEGRWHTKGYIFTFGEMIAVTALIAGILDVSEAERAGGGGLESRREDRGTALLVGGLIGFGGLRLWEMGDAIIAPSTHNLRVRELRERIGPNQPVIVGSHVTPYVGHAHDGGTTAGIAFHF